MTFLAGFLAGVLSGGVIIGLLVTFRRVTINLTKEDTAPKKK